MIFPGLLFALISRVVLPGPFGETIAAIGVAALPDDLRNGGLTPRPVTPRALLVCRWKITIFYR